MMSPIFAIWKKDLKMILSQPLFYILTGLCCCLWGLYFTFDIYSFVSRSFQMSTQQDLGALNIHQHLINSYLVVVFYVLIFIISTLSVRFFTEEKKMQTFPLLLSGPLSSWQLVLSKWLVGASLVFLLLCISSIYPLSLLYFVKVPMVLFFYSYFGLFLILCLSMSLCLLASALTDSVIICVVLSLVFNLILILLGAGRELTEIGFLQDVFAYLSIDRHFSFFRSGIFNLSSIVYFLSACFLINFAVERLIEAHRWR